MWGVLPSKRRRRKKNWEELTWECSLRDKWYAHVLRGCKCMELHWINRVMLIFNPWVMFWTGQKRIMLDKSSTWKFNKKLTKFQCLFSSCLWRLTNVCGKMQLQLFFLFPFETIYKIKLTHIRKLLVSKASWVGCPAPFSSQSPSVGFFSEHTNNPFLFGFVT